jgi:hypothetical protein
MSLSRYRIEDLAAMAVGLALIVFSGYLSRAGRPSYRCYLTPQGERLWSIVYLAIGILAVVIGVLILTGWPPFRS